MPGSMPRARRLPAPPSTVSRAALLVDGSDAEFRGLIHDLIAYGHRLDACRDAFARIAGISGVQYEIVMLVSRAEGLSVSEVAARLHRSGAFITMEANKLVERGMGVLMNAAGVTRADAVKALKASKNQVPVALVMLKAGVDRKAAEKRLKAARGHVRRAIETK